MILRPPRTTRTDPLFPYTTLFRSCASEMSPPSPSSALDVEHADQREQAPRGVEIDLDLAVETFDQHLRRLVVQRAARHVDGLDLLRGRRAGSAARRGGQECVSTCRSRWSPYHSKTIMKIYQHF